MNLMRFEPYREIATLQDRLSRAFGAPFGRPEREDEMNLAAWAPPVDIAETENGMLTLRGERKFEKETEGRSYHRVERSYGQFVRSFSLPNNVDREKIRADFSHGLLKVELPKREDAKPRTIKITNSESTKKTDTIDVRAR